MPPPISPGAGITTEQHAELAVNLVMMALVKFDAENPDLAERVYAALTVNS